MNLELRKIKDKGSPIKVHNLVLFQLCTLHNLHSFGTFRNSVSFAHWVIKPQLLVPWSVFNHHWQPGNCQLLALSTATLDRLRIRLTDLLLYWLTD